jgi:hypothetical protein
MSRMLINESPLMFQPSLAVAIGVNEAIVLQQVHYWLTVSKNEINGFVWVFNTLDQWQEQFPFFSVNTVERTLKSLRDKGFLVAENLSKDKFTRTLYYRIDYPKLGECTSPQNGEMYIRTETTTKNTKQHIAQTDEKPKQVKTKKQEQTITEWIDSGGGVPEDDSVYTKAKTAGIPEEFIVIAWLSFKRRAIAASKKQRDWLQTFRNYIDNPGWLDVYRINHTTKEWYLTDAGIMIQMEILNG